MSYKFLLKQKDYLLNRNVGYSLQDRFHIHLYLQFTYVIFKYLQSHFSLFSIYYNLAINYMLTV